MAFLLPEGGGRYVPQPKKIKTPNIIGGPTGVYAPAAPLKPRTAGQIAPALQQSPVPAGAVRSGEGYVSPNPPSVNASSQYDYSSDPILQQIRASSIKSRDDARSAALARRKRLAILLGEASGIVDDAPTAEAARGNTFSTLAEIARGYQRGVTDIDESFNKRNLFFSGHRGQALGRALEDRNRQEYGARQSVQDALATVERELTAALLAADQADAEAEAEAANRAIARAAQYGFDPGQAAPQSPIATAIATPADNRRINPIFYFK